MMYFLCVLQKENAPKPLIYYTTIVSINGNDYRIHFWYMSQDDAISIMNNFK